MKYRLFVVKNQRVVGLVLSGIMMAPSIITEWVLMAPQISLLLAVPNVSSFDCLHYDFHHLFSDVDLLLDFVV